MLDAQGKEIKTDDKSETVTIPKKDLDDIRAALNTSQEEIKNLRTRFDAGAGETRETKVDPPPAEKAPVRTVTVEMVAEATQNGDYKKAAELSEKMTAEMTAQVAYEFRKQHIEPFVTASLADRSENALASIEGKKHYKRFEKEIKAVLNNLDPQFRARKDVVKACYERVVGEHTEDLEKEAGESAVRQAHEGGGGFEGGGAGRNAGGMSGGGLKIEDVFDEDEAKDVRRIIKQLPGGLDEHVAMLRKNKFSTAKNGQEWLAQVKADREKEAVA